MSRSVAVFIGAGGIGPWQAPEIKRAFANYIIGGGAVIPIILPGVDEIELPEFLDQQTWVDCRDNFLDISALRKIIWGATGRKLNTSICDFSDQFYLSVERKNNHDKVIRVFSSENVYKNRLLHISWNSFGKGINNLVEQIIENGSSLNIDLSVGINDAGLTMAAFINSRCFNRKNLGYIRTEKKHGHILIAKESILPELPSHPSIMLFDFEIKHADVLSKIIGHLNNVYKCPAYYFCVFGAMTEKKDLKIGSIADLVSYEQIVNNNIEDIYISTIMHPPGIEPPLEVK